MLHRVPDQRLIVVGALLVGGIVRWAGRNYTTWDATEFLIPWYAHALEHGIASLGHAYTNYTPPFTYLLLLATLFDGWAPPLLLIKFVSFSFELANAAVAALIVRSVDARPPRPALAFATIWLAPSVLHNGAWWGQADSIWTFFVLLSLYAIMRGRHGLGIVAFGLAFAVKAQAVFFAPLILALVLRGEVRARWLLAVPATYLLAALPVVLAGRSLLDVLGIYVGQAQTYHSLSRNAANFYLFVPNGLYGPGTVIGLALGGVAAIVFAWTLSRARRLSPELILLAACVTLLLMPFALPKMHERYFYAFELAIILLAVVRPHFAFAATVAQLTSALAYMPFDRLTPLGLPIAAITNLILLCMLASCLRRYLADGEVRPDTTERIAATGLQAMRAAWVLYGLMLALLLAAAPFEDASSTWPRNPEDWRGLTIYLAGLGGALLALARYRARRAPVPVAMFH